MAARMPTFLLCVLTIILSFLMFYYLTCSSEVILLRRTAENLEERLRSLTQADMKNQKRLESLSHDQHELEDQKDLIAQKLDEKKNLIEQLQSQIKTQSAQIKTLHEENLALEESINNYKNLTSDLNAKKLLIEKLEQTLHENNKTVNEQLIRMTRELHQYQSKLNETQISSAQLEKKFNETFTSFHLKYHQLEIAYNASVAVAAKTAAELAWLRSITTTTQSTVAVPGNATKLEKDEKLIDVLPAPIDANGAGDTKLNETGLRRGPSQFED